MSDKSDKLEKERDEVERELEKKIIHATRSAESKDYSKAASVYQEMARLAHSVNDRRAIDFCLDAVKYSKKTENKFKTGWSYKCAAEYSFYSKDFLNAVNFAKKAIKYFSEANSMYVVQWCYNIIGRTHEQTKDYTLAVENYKKSMDIEYSKEIDSKIKKLLKFIDSKKDKK
jgi:tetratricopeptide (TPR) repeat protein